MKVQPVLPIIHMCDMTHSYVWHDSCLYVYDVGVCMPTNCNVHLVWRYSPFSQSSLSISVYEINTATHNVIWMCILTCLYVYDVGVCMPTNCNVHPVWRYSPFSQSSLSISVYAYVYWHSLIHISIRVHTFAWTNTYTIYTTLIPQTCPRRPTATCFIFVRVVHICKGRSYL